MADTRCTVCGGELDTARRCRAFGCHTLAAPPQNNTTSGVAGVLTISPPVTAPDARRRAEEARSRYLAAIDADPAFGDLDDETIEACFVLRKALDALLSAPQEREAGKHTPETCIDGHGGALCDRCFSRIVSEPAPAALSPAVREAAEKVKRYYPLNDPDEPLTPFGEDVKALLSALDSNGGA